MLYHALAPIVFQQHIFSIRSPEHGCRNMENANMHQLIQVDARTV